MGSTWRPRNKPSYSCWSSDKGVKTYTSGKMASLTRVLGKLDFCIQKKETRPSALWTEVNSKWIIDLYMTPETLKLPGEDTSQYRCRQDISEKTLWHRKQSQELTDEIMWNKSFYPGRRQSQEWTDSLQNEKKKSLPTTIRLEIIITNIYKELQKLNIKN